MCIHITYRRNTIYDLKEFDLHSRNNIIQYDKAPPPPCLFINLLFSSSSCLLPRQCVHRLNECEHHQTNTRPLPGQRGHASQRHPKVRAFVRCDTSVSESFQRSLSWEKNVRAFASLKEIWQRHNSTVSMETVYLLVRPLEIPAYEVVLEHPVAHFLEAGDVHAARLGGCPPPPPPAAVFSWLVEAFTSMGRYENTWVQWYTSWSLDR